VQTFAVADWKLEDTIICCEDENVARGVEDRRADLAVRKMLFDIDACLRIQGVVEIAGDVVPDVAAV